MGKRRASRELALKILYQVDLTRISVDDAFNEAAAAVDSKPETVEFARRLVETTLEHLDEIDVLLTRYARQWPLERMATVDRQLLRMATCEIVHLPDIPNSVSVDEAVELAKKYSTAESGRFINGILGNLLRDIDNDSACA